MTPTPAVRIHTVITDTEADYDADDFEVTVTVAVTVPRPQTNGPTMRATAREAALAAARMVHHTKQLTVSLLRHTGPVTFHDLDDTRTYQYEVTMRKPYEAAPVPPEGRGCERDTLKPAIPEVLSTLTYSAARALGITRTQNRKTR